MVFKTVIGNSAKGVYFPKNKEELLKLMEEHKNEDTLLQEWIGGTDYSVDCVRWDGFCKMSVYHALVTKTDGGGTTTQREIVEMPQLEAEAKSLWMRLISEVFVVWISVTILKQIKLLTLRPMQDLLVDWQRQLQQV